MQISISLLYLFILTLSSTYSNKQPTNHFIYYSQSILWKSPIKTTSDLKTLDISLAKATGEVGKKIPAKWLLSQLCDNGNVVVKRH